MNDDELPDHLRAALLAVDLDGGPSEPARARMAKKLSAATGIAVAALLPSGVGVGVGVGVGAKILALCVAAAVVGGGIGFAVSEMRPHREAVVETRDAPAPVDAAIPDVDAAAIDAAAIDAGAPTPTPTPTPTIRDAETLARERQLLDAARNALREDDLRLATQNLAEHELRFPRGALVEERRVLAIEVAIKRGDPGTARGLADSFLAEYPRSVFRARVEQLVSGSP